MGKKLEIAAQNQMIKADQLFKARQFKKAGKAYHSAGNTYTKLNEFQIAKKCFLNATLSFVELDKFETVIELLRQASEACLQDNQYLEAYQIYKDVLNYIPKLQSDGIRNYYYTLFFFLSYLCLHTKGSPEEGLDYIKRNRNKIDNEFFKKNDLIQLISEITISLRDKSEKYIEKIQSTVNRLNLRDPESKLLKDVILLTKSQILVESSLTLDKETYTTDDIITLNLFLNSESLAQVVNDPFFNYQVKSFQITKITVNASDNLTTTKKPDLPFSIDFSSKFNLPFLLKPHFQMDNPKIGPLILTFELNNLLIFNYETQMIIPKLISPPATLEVSIKNLRPPLLDQTFPLEILIENHSKGEALNINLELNLPDELKIMRGITNKQIYSLRTNETIKWEVNLKPIEVGDYIIKINMKFKDPDENLIEDIKEFPFSIKM